MVAKNKSMFVKVHLRFLAAILITAFLAVLLPHSIRLPARMLCLWNVGMITFLSLTWWVMLRATPTSMRRNAQREDAGRVMILGLVTAAACVSLGAIAFLLRDGKTLTPPVLAFHVALSITTIVGSWLLVHTIFALHYARGYYQNRADLTERQAEGLEFPKDIEPDYWDFLYFSFVIGMTSQVSDVEISSREMRRLALLHGVLSFFFNTTLLAMSINIIAGLL